MCMNSRVNAFVEPCEQRRLFAASLSNGVLTITGTEGNDFIEADLRDDGRFKVEINNREQNFTYSQITRIVVQGLGGNDSIEFNQRNLITIGAEVRAGDGRDTVEGTDARDTIYGGAGNDRLDGRSGSDIIYGESGHDYIEGKNGNDKLYGGSGNDFLQGGTGNDTMNGQAGQDDLQGNRGTDRLTGGSGNDDFDDSDSSSEILDRTGEDNGANAVINI